MTPSSSSRNRPPVIDLSRSVERTVKAGLSVHVGISVLWLGTLRSGPCLGRGLKLQALFDCCSLNKISIKAFISEPVVRLCYLRRMDIKPLVAQHNKTLLSSQVPISSLIHGCEWRGLNERQCTHCTSPSLFSFHHNTTSSSRPSCKTSSVFVICLQVVVKLVSGEVCDVRVVRLELRRIDCRLYLSLSDKGDLVSWRGK